MCLHSIDPGIAVEVMVEGTQKVGWKIFEESHKKREFQTMSKCFGERRPKIPLEKWISERKFRPSTTAKNKNHISTSKETIKYHKGFHFFIYKEDALEYCDPGRYRVRKVWFKYPITFGYQYGVPVGVAREIYIHRRRKSDGCDMPEVQEEY